MYLDNYDIACLKLIDGQEQDLFHGWGAALSITSEKCKVMGLIQRRYNETGSMGYVLTEKGKEVLENV